MRNQLDAVLPQLVIDEGGRLHAVHGISLPMVHVPNGWCDAIVFSAVVQRLRVHGDIDVHVADIVADGNTFAVTRTTDE